MRFLAPGYFKYEKSAFLTFLVATSFLLFLGVAMVYYIIFPMAATFFIGFEVAATENTLPIQLEPKVNEYLSLLMQLIFAFGLCFQLPVVMTLLARVGLATAAGMAPQRTYPIVCFFLVAALFTPPAPLLPSTLL